MFVIWNVFAWASGPNLVTIARFGTMWPRSYEELAYAAAQLIGAGHRVQDKAKARFHRGPAEEGPAAVVGVGVGMRFLEQPDELVEIGDDGVGSH